MSSTRRRASIFRAALVAGALATAAAAQEPRAMTPVDVIEVPSLGDARLSPDGGRVAYVLSEADWKQNKRVPHLWWTEIEGGESRRLTSGENGERSPRWSPDGSWIAFVAKRGKDEKKPPQVWLLPTRGGEAHRLTSHPTAVSSISWSPDGEAIYFLAADDESDEEKAAKKRKDDVRAFEESYHQKHLWRVRVADGEETRVTGGDFTVVSYELSRDGRRVAHHRAPSPLIDDLDEGEVWSMAADGSDAVRLTSNGVPEGGAELSPDGSQVLFLSASDGESYYYNSNLFVVPAGGGDPRLLLEDFPGEISAAVWVADGTIRLIASTGLRSQLYALDPSGNELRALTEGDHSVRGWHHRPDSDRDVLVLSDPATPGEVWLVADGTPPRRVTHHFDDLVRKFRLPRVEATSWRGDDGVTVEGLVWYPLGYEPGRRYPLVVQTHGGPRSSDKFGFGRWINYPQVLTARGWAVLQPNYRGSTGYGDAFLRDMVGHYFRNAHLDVLAGVDHLVAMGLADPDRLVKMGWSGGGHMTNKIITFTNRFKAASSGAGASDWLSMYSQSDTRIQRTPWFGGEPWDEDADVDLWWSQSPLSEIWKVQTPTLVLVGADDERVPPQQSIELWRGLRANGVPTKLWMAPREPHGWRELRHQLFKINVELEWFEKWALGREYEWVQAPGDEDAVSGDEEAPAVEAGAPSSQG